jgi:hypothetical protein
MALNEQIDDNAADLRNIQADSQSSQTNVPNAPVAGSPSRNVSRTQIILAVGIMIAAVTILYLFLQKRSTFNPSPPIPVQQPFRTDKSG